MKVGRKLTKDNIKKVPRGTVIMYDEGSGASFGFLARHKKGIYFRAFFKMRDASDKRSWMVRNYQCYTISTKEKFLIYQLEHS